MQLVFMTSHRFTMFRGVPEHGNAPASFLREPPAEVMRKELSGKRNVHTQVKPCSQQNLGDLRTADYNVRSE